MKKGCWNCKYEYNPENKEPCHSCFEATKNGVECDKWEANGEIEE